MHIMDNYKIQKSGTQQENYISAVQRCLPFKFCCVSMLKNGIFYFSLISFYFFFAYLIIETTVYYGFRKITCELAICPFLFCMGGKIIRM